MITDMIREGKVKIILKAEMLNADELDEFTKALNKLNKISIDDLIQFLNLEGEQKEYYIKKYW